ncbi:protein LTO1 homolog [Scylla paramamosain]|uniref:protein LTO1 homolog n=1 Tax=Scylla paramamosain TaxID=85552 RepID=UPI003083E9BF
MEEKNEDLFDAVYALEQQKYGEGQTEGTEEGHKNHYQQGFLLGWQQACHLLHELGTVEGLLSSIAVNRKAELSPRTHSQVVRLLEDLQGWPSWDPSEKNIEEKLRGIHTRARNLLRRVGISVKVVDRSVDSEF